MSILESCPICGDIPVLSYVCGEYFVFSLNDGCPCCGISFNEFHSSEEIMIDAWNKQISFFKGVIL